MLTPDPVLLLEQVETLWQENAALRAQNAPLQARNSELEARLGQNSSNSSRLPSSDPPQAPRKRSVVPSGRQRGGHRDTAGYGVSCCQLSRWTSPWLQEGQNAYDSLFDEDGAGTWRCRRAGALFWG